MTIGEMIRNKRKEIGMTQQELGNILQVSSQMIAQYEKDKRKPKIETLRKICASMNITIGELGDDIWKYYSAEEVVSDWTTAFRAGLHSSLSQVPAQMELALKQGVKNVAESIHCTTEQAQKHAHEIVDSDWKCMFLLSHFEKLNSNGRNEAIKRVEELTEIKKYTEEDF